MKLKKIIIVGALAVMVLIGLTIYYYQTKSKLIIDSSRKDISLVTIMSGNTGEIKELTNEEADEFYGILKNTRISKEKKVESDGWIYRIKAYNEKDEVIEDFTMNNGMCYMNGYEYSIKDEDSKNIIGYIKKITKW